MAGPKLSVPRVEKALREHHGIILKASEALGCSRLTLYKFIEKNPHLEEVRREADAALLDIAESWVTTAVKTGDMKTTRWFLDRKGKQRGYTQRIESTGADGAPLEYSEVRRTIVDPTKKEPEDD